MWLLPTWPVDQITRPPTMVSTAVRMPKILMPLGLFSYVITCIMYKYTSIHIVNFESTCVSYNIDHIVFDHQDRLYIPRMVYTEHR